MMEKQGQFASLENDRFYGGLFCATGKEQAVAERIMQTQPGVRAIVARREKHQTNHGRKTRIQVIALPSYVFFEASSDIVPTMMFAGADVIRILTSGDGSWQLWGSDEQFVRWLFQYNGLIGFSKACREGDRIRILSGPLKDLEGYIKRVDKRGRSGQVSLNFNGRSTLVWLGFELIEDLTEKI